MSQDDLITMVVFSGLELICVLILLVAALKIVITFVRAQRLLEVPGSVVAHQAYRATMQSASGYGSSHPTLVKPVVRCTAPDGRVIDVLHPVGSNSPPPIGTPMTVALDPRDPTRAQVVSGLARYLGAGVTLIAVGILLAVLVGVHLSILR